MGDTSPTTPAAPLTKADLPEIIQRYQSGESMLTIAQDTVVGSRQLYNWIMQALGPEYESVQTECLINRVADADRELQQATDVFQVTRAREIARYARMDLERRRPHLYGPKQETKQETTIRVIVEQLAPQPIVVEAAQNQVKPAEASQVLDVTGDVQE